MYRIHPAIPWHLQGCLLLLLRGFEFFCPPAPVLPQLLPVPVPVPVLRRPVPVLPYHSPTHNTCRSWRSRNSSSAAPGLAKSGLAGSLPHLSFSHPPLSASSLLNPSSSIPIHRLSSPRPLPILFSPPLVSYPIQSFVLSAHSLQYSLAHDSWHLLPILFTYGHSL
ncbi:hypothetical protein F5Y18DRAFT_93099 [Xylariaceae sp. FL1019]|nr:hypothetical protein F5Y18DRAFT_93099 [Xylariaceae sp. FL1019]